MDSTISYIAIIKIRKINTLLKINNYYNLYINRKKKKNVLHTK